MFSNVLYTLSLHERYAKWEKALHHFTNDEQRPKSISFHYANEKMTNWCLKHCFLCCHSLGMCCFKKQLKVKKRPLLNLHGKHLNNTPLRASFY